MLPFLIVTPVASFFPGATSIFVSAELSLLFPALSTAHTFILCFTFACVVFDGAVIVFVISSLSSPLSILYINLPNPLDLGDDALVGSVNSALIFTTAVLSPSTFNDGVFGFVVSIFAYAGFKVHSPLFPALSTALTNTNSDGLFGSVFSFTVNEPVASL